MWFFFFYYYYFCSLRWISNAIWSCCIFTEIHKNPHTVVFKKSQCFILITMILFLNVCLTCLFEQWSVLLECNNSCSWIYFWLFWNKVEELRHALVWTDIQLDSNHCHLLHVVMCKQRSDALWNADINGMNCSSGFGAKTWNVNICLRLRISSDHV